MYVNYFLKQLEILNTIEPFIGEWFSKEYVQRHVFRMSEEEMKKMQKQIEDEPPPAGEEEPPPEGTPPEEEPPPEEVPQGEEETQMIQNGDKL